MFAIRDQSNSAEVYLKMVDGDPCLMISKDEEAACICFINKEGQLELGGELDEENEFGLDVVDDNIVVIK